MNGYAYQLVPALVLATAGMTAAALVTWCLLRYSRAVSPRVHRLAWCAVLLVGWSFARLPIEVPWYEPVPPAELAANLDEALPTLSVAPPNEEMIEASADSGIIELSGTYEELSSEPVASAAGDEPLIELSATPELPAPILAEMPPVSLDPLPAVSTTPEPVVRPFWADIDPWLTLAAAWAVGIGAIVLAWLLGYLWFILRLPVGRAADPSWLEDWRTLLDSRGVRRTIPLRVTKSLGPMLCRMPWGYSLVVPEPLWRELDDSARAAILRHELAHYERGDVWWSLVARVLALPNWFNPASWYCVRKFDEAAEWACDHAATADQPVTDYAKALLRLGTDAHGYASYRPAAAGKPLAGRIRRLLRLRDARDSKVKAALLIAAALVMAVAALVRVELVAREAPPTEEKIADNESQPQPVDAPDPVGPLADDAQLQPVDASESVGPLPGEGGPPEPLGGSEIPGPVDEEQPQPVTESRLALEAPSTQTKVRAAGQAAAEAAKKAYEGMVAAYATGTGSIDSVYTWSMRLMSAAERVIPALKDGEEGEAVEKSILTAANEHLERMNAIQKQVKALYDVGAKGGEAETMAAVNYYVAEAERIVAEREAALPKFSGALQLDFVPQSRGATVKPAPAPSTPAARPTPVPTAPAGQPLRTPDVIGPIESTEVKPPQNERPIQGNPTIAPAPRSTPAPVAAPAARPSAPTLVPAVPQSGLTVDITADLKGADYVTAGDTAEFKIAVANKGRTRFSQVKIAVKWDYYIQPVAVTDGYTWQDKEIVWLVDELPTGKTHDFQLNCRVANDFRGTAHCLVTVTTREGPSSNAQADLQVRSRAGEAATLAPGEDPFAKVATVPNATVQPAPNNPFAAPTAAPVAEVPTSAPAGRPFGDGRTGGGLGGRSMGGGLGRGLSGAVPEPTVAVESAPKRVSRSKLRYDGKTFDEWSELLSTELSDDELTRAVKALAAFGANGYGSEAADAVLANSSKLTNTGDAVYFAFLAIPREDSVPKLLVAAKSKRAEIRRAAISMLGKAIAEPQEFAALFEELVSDPDASVRTIALLNLASSAPQGEEIKRALKLALHDADPVVLSSAASILMGTSHNGNKPMDVPPLPELAEDLVPLLTNDGLQKRDGTVLPNVIKALVRCGPAAKVALPTVTAWLAVPASPIEPKKGLPMRLLHALAIIEAVGPEARDVQENLVELLKYFVLQMPQDGRGDAWVFEYTKEILEALAAIGNPPKEVVPVLVEAIDRDSRNRVAMIKLLDQIGPDAAAAVPVLQRILHLSGIGIDVADAAREALKKIQPESK